MLHDEVTIITIAGSPSLLRDTIKNFVCEWVITDIQNRLYSPSLLPNTIKYLINELIYRIGSTSRFSSSSCRPSTK